MEGRYSNEAKTIQNAMDVALVLTTSDSEEIKKTAEEAWQILATLKNQILIEKIWNE